MSPIPFAPLRLFRAAFLAIMGAVTGTALAADPKPAPGMDPGGAAIAIISDGLDYTIPGIADRLARDGEGEIVGFDFADGDRYPFKVDGEGTELARSIIAEAPTARIAPVRASLADPVSLGRSAAFAGQSPARVALVTLTGGTKEAWEPFRQAAVRFSRVLFIVLAGEDGAGPAPPYPAALALDNLLVVAAPAVPSASREAARIAARAAQIAEAEPDLTGAALNQRVLTLARPEQSP